MPYALHIEVEQTNPQGVSAVRVPRTKKKCWLWTGLRTEDPLRLEHIVVPKGKGSVTGHKGKLLKRCHGLHIEVEQTNPQGVSALLVPRTKKKVGCGLD